MMKFFIYITFCFISLSAMDIKDIIESIDKMNNSSKIPTKIDYDLYDPFSSAKPILNTKLEKVEKNDTTIQPIVIETILNNRVFIDGRWYNEGDKVREFDIKSIGSDSIMLMKNYKETIIRLKKTETILDMREQKK